MLNYLIVLLDQASTSFCYYTNPAFSKNNSSKPIPYNTLNRVVNYALKNSLMINYLFGIDPLPDKYQKLIAKSQHVKILPARAFDHFSDEEVVLVINESELEFAKTLEDNFKQNIILRFPKSNLPELSAYIELLINKCRRLNLNLLDINKYDTNDLEEYKRQLDLIYDIVEDRYLSGHSVELSFISDRMMLSEMNNCNAGLTHLTVAPNGKFYLCPGFYFDDVNNSVGDLNSGINIKNQQLLDLEHAPICRICDAYHCKRCIYLNQKTTLEINTPSHEQCVVSHLERNTSKLLLDELNTRLEVFHDQEPIPEIDYLDPFELAKKTPGKKQNFTKKVSHDQYKKYEQSSDRELLLEILGQQDKILKLLNSKTK